MKILLTGILFVFPLFLYAQDIPPTKLSKLAMKVAYFNKDKCNKFRIVYKKGLEDRAKGINEFLGGQLVEFSEAKESIDYVNVIFVGLSNEEIVTVKSKYRRVLSISDKLENIEKVSISFELLDNGRSKIVVNLTNAKKEADFRAQFLKIARVK
jgi:hypothetical protein